ncbi:uncharacterized protein RJT20DRAFT_150154, partial [Scheffersomyces xylosifermentans]|uniref:uncharacterized protein n=1 Tax=Scheffersomyces xylosifermentans TaxID=1304137 RepID=UPI00315C81F7
MSSTALDPSADLPKPKRTRKFDKRSRDGCLTCKKRRVKCDESHPRCHNCVRLKLTCNYGIKLLWEDEAIAKGISFGRSKQNKLIRQQTKRSFLLPNEKKQLTLSEMLQNDKAIKWVKSTNDRCNLFLNTTYDDFNKIFNMITKDDLELKNYSMSHPNSNVVISIADSNNSDSDNNSEESIVNQLSINSSNELVVTNPDIFTELFLENAES